jgi:uncharacterized membrane protein YGL010W
VNDPLSTPLLAEYATSHRDKRNLVCHEIGIPLIVLGIVALMHLGHVGPIDLGTIATVLVSFYYVRLIGAAAVPAVVALIALYALGTFVPWWLALAFFAVGWAFQFVGHVYEGKKPAFLTNLSHLLVGPLWIVVRLGSRRAT